MSQKHWTTEIKQSHDGELYIDIPESILEELKWDETTSLEWVFPPNGTTVILKRKEE
jgi:hypothetical protein